MNFDKTVKLRQQNKSVKELSKYPRKLQEKLKLEEKYNKETIDNVSQIRTREPTTNDKKSHENKVVI